MLAEGDNLPLGAGLCVAASIQHTDIDDANAVARTLRHASQNRGTGHGDPVREAAG